MKTVREMRVEQGWTQLELANALDVTPTTIYKWEAGQVIPGIVQLRKVATLFDVAIEDIALVGVDVDREGKPLKTAA